MGIKGDAPSPSPSPSIVCCMCGDHGLPQELFRCKVCLVRSQHKYCSDRYPKVESYHSCNWCLREEARKAGARNMAGDQQSSPSGNDGRSNSDNNGTGSGVKLHRQAFQPHHDKPIKKQRLPERPSSEGISPTFGRARYALRGKVRRYKLLEEVIS